MSFPKENPGEGLTDRRTFLRSTAGVAGAALAGSLSVERTAHAAGAGRIRIGLIGCGGRGTDAAINAMNAGQDVQLIALADIFEERLASSLDRLRSAKGEQVNPPRDHRFVGFDAYLRLLETDIDAVLIAAASHFHPRMLEAAVRAGKHVFCEKPHAIDIPGLKVATAAAKLAEERRLNIVSGLCWRYDPGVRETMKRVHDGAIGDIIAIQEKYVSRPYIVRERRPGQSEMEYQMWNWYHFNWLSGDQTAQQLVHSLDKASWALGDVPPVKAWGMGGRQTCLDPVYGDQFDHQAVVFEYANGAHVFGFTRDQPECYNNTSDLILGAKGRCNVMDCHITGAENWRYDGPRPSMYDVEHEELFAAIRDGKTINDGRYMCLSSALAVVAQIACYSGELILWEEAMKSRRSFALAQYAWDARPPVAPGPDGRYPTAMPGQAEFENWRI